MSMLHHDFLVSSGSGLGFRGLSPCFLSFFFFSGIGRPMNSLLHMNVVETWFVAVWGLCWCNLEGLQIRTNVSSKMGRSELKDHGTTVEPDEGEPPHPNVAQCAAAGIILEKAMAGLVWNGAQQQLGQSNGCVVKLICCTKI